jgi:hypothetical protein
MTAESASLTRPETVPTGREHAAVGDSRDESPPFISDVIYAAAELVV